MKAVNCPNKEGNIRSRIRGEIIGIKKRGWTSTVSNGALRACEAAD